LILDVPLRRWSIVASIVACHVLLAQQTLAQEVPEGARAADVIAPRLISSAEVAYPTGANGDAVVTLVVTINADGTVRSARATAGQEPFSSAAIQASLGWRFEPATRAQHAVASIIRLEIEFKDSKKQPEARPDPKSPTDSTLQEQARQGGPAIGAEEPTPIEVQVVGEKLAPAVSSLTRAEVRQLPGAFGDPFRAIEMLPGVTPIVSGLPYFYVRGAPPGNVGYFLDGVRVPYLYHVALGPSVIHPGMVERVDLYPGGYPASFGRFSGGIVSGETTSPRAELHGEANIRLFDAGAMAETGFAGGRGTVLLGGRYSYTAAIISLIAPNVDLAYHDYQARVTYDLTPHDRISAFSFGAYDLVGTTKNNLLTVLFGSEFYRANVRYDHSFGEASSLRSEVTLGYDQSRIGDQRNSQDRMLSVKAELHHRLSGKTLLRAGADATIDGYTADSKTYADPDDPTTVRFNNLFPPRTDLALGAWADVVWHPTPQLEVTPGVRVDLYRSQATTVPAVDPRLAARFKLTDKLRIVHAYGLAHQPPSFVVPIPGLTPAGLSGGLQSSWQTSAGIEWDLPGATTATASLFHNAFFNMSDALGVVSSNNTGNTLDRRSTGSGVGFELFIHRRLTKRVGGYVSYTLSRSTRTLDGYTFPSSFDRTHVANGALSYDIGRNWRAGTRLVFYTGVPKTTSANGSSSTPSSHPPRDPNFYRIDIRLEKRWSITQRAWVSFVFEVMNVTLNKETFGSSQIGPITIPSVGLEAGF
jgi:TonB-dependent Receptor Plug Domain/Gram-negative bacterial TonB protein C-terminal